MQKGFVNFAFAHFAALLLIGSVFAEGNGTMILNSPPVITGVGGPSSLNAGEAGTWSLSAYDPNGNYLSYSVNWSDGLGQAQAGQSPSTSTATFQHTYSSAGTYTITFTVTDSLGASTQSSITTTVLLAATSQADLSVEALSISTDSNGVTRFVPTIKNVGSATASGYTLTYYLDGAAVATQTSSSNLAAGASESNELDRGMISSGQHTMKVKITLPPGASNANSANDEMTRTFEIAGNKAPIITGVKSPVSLSVNEQGTWYVSAYDPDGTYLSYSVMWGDEGETPVYKVETGSSATFEHSYAKAGTYTVIFIVKDSQGASVQNSARVVVGSPTGNQPPVITSVSGPTEISTGKAGTWKISAYDPDGTYLTYSAMWGESRTTPSEIDNRGRTGNSASFEYTYYNAGAYTIVFTVTDSAGASTKSSVTVKVGDSISNSEVYASVGAIPTELYQYDSVHVTGKVSRGNAASSDENKVYLAVLTLDNGNSVYAETAVASQSGSIASVHSSEKSESATTSQGSSGQGTSGQGKEEEITLAPGESREVSAYFTASHLGTNFAKLMVYERYGGCIEQTSAVDHESSGNCKGSYRLVASDTVKVYVKEGGIPSPPGDKIALKLERGWNQVSVPTGYEVSLSDIQKKCDVTSAWYYNTALGQYSAATTFGKGMIGVWMKAGSACTYELDAPYITTWSSSLKAGWNMIGSPASGATFASVAGNCKVTSGPWNYSPSAGQYSYSSKLEPGKGYWVKVASDCTLQDLTDSPPPVPGEIVPTSQATTQKAQSVETAQSVHANSAD